MSSFAFCSMSDSWCDPSVEDLERDLDLMDVDPMFHPDVLIPNPPISIVGRPPDVTGAADAAALADADSEHVGALAEPRAAHFIESIVVEWFPQFLAKEYFRLQEMW
eukprot:TRINITY_DN162_c0_g1_i1.p1 TRINITY_DN162_c0_g1~~TRINITY_DN162_c0_g1_i1.p1  ORF type:complete len:107 (+),score=35.12 TRINITY_DN162_c0_g1_i1:185-505(+)